jgi:hypothetical protein
MEHSELLINAAVAKGITSIAIGHDRFDCLPTAGCAFSQDHFND